MEPNPETPVSAESPLHHAARVGDHAAIRVLIAVGNGVNETAEILLVEDGGKHPATPLMLAAGSGEGASAETLRLLIDLGADPNLVTDGRSVFSFACFRVGWG